MIEPSHIEPVALFSGQAHRARTREHLRWIYTSFSLVTEQLLFLFMRFEFLKAIGSDELFSNVLQG